MQIPISTEYYLSPDTLGLECACTEEGLILTIRQETHIMQKGEIDGGNLLKC